MSPHSWPCSSTNTHVLWAPKSPTRQLTLSDLLLHEMTSSDYLDLTDATWHPLTNHSLTSSEPLLQRQDFQLTSSVQLSVQQKAMEPLLWPPTHCLRDGLLSQHPVVNHITVYLSSHTLMLHVGSCHLRWPPPPSAGVSISTSTSPETCPSQRGKSKMHSLC